MRADLFPEFHRHGLHSFTCISPNGSAECSMFLEGRQSPQGKKERRKRRTSKQVSKQALERAISSGGTPMTPPGLRINKVICLWIQKEGQRGTFKFLNQISFPWLPTGWTLHKNQSPLNEGRESILGTKTKLSIKLTSRIWESLCENLCFLPGTTHQNKVAYLDIFEKDEIFLVTCQIVDLALFHLFITYIFLTRKLDISWKVDVRISKTRKIIYSPELKRDTVAKLGQWKAVCTALKALTSLNSQSQWDHPCTKIFIVETWQKKIHQHGKFTARKASWDVFFFLWSRC